MINTGLLTDTVIDTMTAKGVLTGDGVAPKEGGWVGGAPNVDAFKSYTVVGYDGAIPTMEGVNLYPEWLVTYALRSYGGSRLQLDWQSNLARNAFMDVNYLEFDDYKVIGILWRNLGGVSRVDQTDPSMWQSFDSVALYCAATG